MSEFLKKLIDAVLPVIHEENERHELTGVSAFSHSRPLAEEIQSLPNRVTELEEKSDEEAKRHVILANRFNMIKTSHGDLQTKVYELEKRFKALEAKAHRNHVEVHMSAEQAAELKKAFVHPTEGATPGFIRLDARDDDQPPVDLGQYDEPGRTLWELFHTVAVEHGNDYKPKQEWDDCPKFHARYAEVERRFIQAITAHNAKSFDWRVGELMKQNEVVKEAADARIASLLAENEGLVAEVHRLKANFDERIKAGDAAIEALKEELAVEKACYADSARAAKANAAERAKDAELIASLQARLLKVEGEAKREDGKPWPLLDWREKHDDDGHLLRVAESRVYKCGDKPWQWRIATEVYGGCIVYVIHKTPDGGMSGPHSDLRSARAYCQEREDAYTRIQAGYSA